MKYKPKNHNIGNKVKTQSEKRLTLHQELVSYITYFNCHEMKGNNYVET